MMRFLLIIKGYYNLLFKSKFNIIKTLYINFRMFPFHMARKLPVYVYGSWKFIELRGSFVINAPVKRGMILMGVNIAGYVITPSGSLRMKKGSQIIFHEKTSLSQGCQIYLNDFANLEFHREVKLGDAVKIFCYKYISIGEMSEVTWESQVTDFNSHYIENLTTRQISNIIKPVYIGKRNWIGNRSTIMPGTRLPDNIIVTSNSLLNKDYILLGINEYSLIGGMPARMIKHQVKRIYSHKNEAILRKHFDSMDREVTSDEVLIEIESYG